MDDNISGFFGPVSDYGQPDRETFTLIHSSEEGFFELYRGERAGRFRVYKCLKPQWRGNLLQETMLRKEFETGYSLTHPNICQVYSYMEIASLGSCIEMEWVDGDPLDVYLRGGLPDERTFQKLAGELCDAVGYLHNRQVLHRDLKPSNILVTHEGSSIKLVDFGLADTAAFSVLKAPAGTRRWVAPEVLDGNDADARSDIYSLGAVLREMTSRHRSAIRRCLRKDPARRYGSAAAVKEALSPKRALPWLIVGLSALLLLLSWLLFQARPLSAPVPEPPVPTLPADTVFVPVPVQEQTSPAAPKPSPKGKKKDDPDRIFREATELFEDLL